MTYLLASATGTMLGATFAVYAAASYAALQRINDVVGQPYMDEIFHVPQAQHYCIGDFNTWDPKLTTPPGLYLVSLIPINVLRFLMPQYAHACTAGDLRATNWMLSLALFWVIADILRQLRPGQPPVVLALRTLGLSLFPVTFFLNHMYYTDTGSLLFVLVCYTLSLRERHWMAGVTGFAALWFRQTNAVWVAFVGFTAALRLVQQRTGISDMSSLRESLGVLCRWTVQRDAMAAILRLLYPYLAVVCLFALFVVANRGIVLGDKSNHEAGLHVPQPWRSLVFGTALGLLMALCIRSYTVEHPFLLSDNRHYPFYIWKNIFRRHWLTRYLAIPLYTYSACAVHHVLARQTPALWQLALVICTAAVLVPSPLLEFRYFTVPYFFVRLHMRDPTGARYLAIEITWFALINAATIWVFLHRPFTWDSEPRQLQRFMW
ncbi:glucosyltransferase [Coemansia asiatica]|uniref:Dol-P-Glc:Glc(2)Man(9)GlcNAc(2)-PP-Dol alpha-1,2-glucosyltransferase n=1 Tax=Coemansia asiatica TaxID=1052880 RepID=A0A9W7XKA8_9FUNG|nr:glucosyltransferase [Coemansia asiatica]